MKRKKNQKIWNAITQKIPDYNIKVGWFENSKYSDGTPIGGIAAVQNYGATINQTVTEKQRKFLMLLGIFLKKTTTALHIVIPPTHFMENCQKKNKEKWRKLIHDAWISVFVGDIEPDKAVEQIAAAIEGDLVKEIARGEYPPDKPSTILQKRSKYKDTKTTGSLNKRLVNTGQMLNSVSHQVEKK